MGAVAGVVGFVRLSRLHFLAGGFLMYGLGAAAVAGVEGVEIDGRSYLWGQLLVTAAQITAHYVNEYADVEADRRIVNRTLFSGGSGMLSDGTLAPAVALWAAAASSIVAVIATIATVARPGPHGWLIVLGLGSLAVSWAYSMPPVRLLDRGVGELATSLVVAGAVPLIGALAQGVDPPTPLWWAIGTLVPVHVAMMLAFELPDLAADERSGKRVAAVRLGPAATIAMMAVLAVAAVAVALGGGVVGAAGGLPGAVVVVLALRRQPAHLLLTVGAVAAFVGVGLGALVELA